jgi:hypothetical protein
MDKKQASSIIKDAFGSVFSRDKFIEFIGNLLNLNSTDYSHRNIGIYDTYKQHVESLEVVAKFNDGKNEIDVLIVTLIRDTSLDKARTMQRNFIARYLSDKQGDAAIVAFTSPDAEDWRFSLIKMDLGFKKTDTGIKVKQEFTPAKRWSFLVGENENSHTAQSQLVGILANDEDEPTLDELEQAFSIETVTNEFYEKYTDLFLRMKEALDTLLENDSQLKTDFKEKDVDTVDFAKKTMGQMAFLYFLQKKGWFGVKADKEWGTGVKNFLREVFERREKYEENFFDDVLEPLFYKALAQDRSDKNDIYSELNGCRMPFLNGGLFEPMNGYSWSDTHIRLPDELFSNDIKTKEGDIGDGILDVFDRYNFTVNESEPLEQEVAVDPEMLGKVFENLLEIKDRKSKGAFYTPREIVHYMCQESLINYLETETNSLIPKVDIESFIQQGSQIIQNDKSIIEQGGDKGKLLLRQSVIDQAEELDDLLANIKVCDPAVGSGAFPLGMLNEIVTARTILGIHLRNNSSAYKLKLHAISNSIYGVDIDPGAVEIAKLRFWLSLVVEEDNPTPLPNLEHKIMQGNSLVSRYEGIELFDDDLLNNTESVKRKISEENKIIDMCQDRLLSHESLSSVDITSIKKDAEKAHKRIKSLEKKLSEVATAGLFDKAREVARQKAKLLQSKIAEYITIDSKTNKENLKQEIDNLKWDLIEATLEDRGETDKLDKIKKLKKDRIKPFFIWKLEFGEVFKNNGGFDVVIGNPPYGGEKITNDLKEYLGLTSKDVYGAFISNAINDTNSILKSNGFLSFIVSDTFMTIKSHLALRKQILNKKLQRIIRLHPDTFKATVNTAIILVHKTENKSEDICEVADFTNISVHEEYDLFLKILEETRGKQQVSISTERYSIFHYPQKLIYTNSSLPLFMCHPKLFRLMNDANTIKCVEENIEVSNIALNKAMVKLVKFGDIAAVRQGLATGDNSNYFYQNPQARGRYKNIENYKDLVFSMSDLYAVANNNKLRKKAIERGFHKSINEENFDKDLYFDGKYILPYDKGGASDLNEGWLPNYYVPTDYYIDWSQESINRMNSLTTKERNVLNNKSGGNNKVCSRFQNADTYFKDGITFSWTGQYSPTFRIATPAPYDHGSSDIFCDKYPISYLIGLTCSKLLKFMARNIINHTVNFGIDDVKDFVIPFNNNKKLEKLVDVVIDKQKRNNRYDYMSNEQREIDELVYHLYGLNEGDIQEVEKWYARRYPKLRKWCYISEDAINSPL